jgi:hypothetical protein
MTCRVSLAAVTGGGKRRRYGHLPNRGQFLEASSKMLLVLACAATRALSFKIKPAPQPPYAEVVMFLQIQTVTEGDLRPNEARPHYVCFTSVIRH